MISGRFCSAFASLGRRGDLFSRRALAHCLNLIWALCFALPPLSQAQMHDGAQLVVAKLVAENSSVTPGKPFAVGLLLKMQPGWHTYWEYPGDSGLPTKIDWRLPPGFTAGALQWPLPVREDDEGDLQTYVYNDEVMLLAEITPPAQLQGQEVIVNASASWLVCEKSCVPGKADLALALKVGEGGASPDAYLFAKYRALLPQSSGMPFTARWSTTPTAVTLDVKGASGAVDLLPLPRQGTSVEHPKKGVNGDSITFTIPAHRDDSATNPQVDAVVAIRSPDGATAGWSVFQPEAGVAPSPTSVGSGARALEIIPEKRPRIGLPVACSSSLYSASSAASS